MVERFFGGLGLGGGREEDIFGNKKTRYIVQLGIVSQGCNGVPTKLSCNSFVLAVLEGRFKKSQPK